MDIHTDNDVTRHLTEVFTIRIGQSKSLVHHHMVFHVVNLRHTHGDLPNNITLKKAFILHSENDVGFLDFLIVHLFQVDENVLIKVNFCVNCDIVLYVCFFRLA